MTLVLHSDCIRDKYFKFVSDFFFFLLYFCVRVLGDLCQILVLKSVDVLGIIGNMR